MAYAGVAQLIERLLAMQKARGLSPLTRTKLTPRKAPLIGSFLFIDRAVGFNLRPVK